MSRELWNMDFTGIKAAYIDPGYKLSIFDSQIGLVVVVWLSEWTYKFTNFQINYSYRIRGLYIYYINWIPKTHQFMDNI